FNEYGSTQGTESLDDVAPNGSGKVDHSGLPNQYYGAGRMSANQPLASVVQVSDSSIYRRLGYSGLAAGDDRVWLPFVMTRLGNDWGGDDLGAQHDGHRHLELPEPLRRP
ncbi:MAG: hypothetical protein SXV54_18460, partial [Chloroflexota bacterium]|nr:hypothetical protein [Chloroflexota bacterium]